MQFRELPFPTFPWEGKVSLLAGYLPHKHMHRSFNYVSFMDWQDIVFVFFDEQTSRVATLTNATLREERRQRVKKQQRVNSRF